MSDVLALPNGRTLVAVGSNGRVGLLRYLRNGAPDTTFSGDGLVLTTIPRAGGPWIPGGAAVAPNGRIFPSAENQEGDVAAVVRYRANSSPDTGFNGDGIAFATTFRGQQHCGGRPDVAVGATSRPLVAFGGGYAFCSWSAAVLNTNGTLLRRLHEDGGDFSFAHETAVLANGRLLVMGTAGDGNDARAFRYLADGTGAGGNDSFCALSGNHVLRGGTGADRLDGGTGNDRLDGDGGNDNLFGGSGTDDCSGGDGTDTGTGCELVEDIP